MTRTISQKEKIFRNIMGKEMKKFLVTIEYQVNEMFLRKDGYHADDQTQEEIVDHKKDQYENGVKEL